MSDTFLQNKNYLLRLFSISIFHFKKDRFFYLPNETILLKDDSLTFNSINTIIEALNTLEISYSNEDLTTPFFLARCIIKNEDFMEVINSSVSELMNSYKHELSDDDTDDGYDDYQENDNDLFFD